MDSFLEHRVDVVRNHTVIPASSVAASQRCQNDDLLAEWPEGKLTLIHPRMRNDELSFEIIKRRTIMLWASVEYEIVVSQDVKVDCPRAIAYGFDSSDGVFDMLDEFEQLNGLQVCLDLR